jgi:hypothetical protein
MKRQKRTASNAIVPVVAVSVTKIAENEDWYTPKVLRFAPLKISVTLGQIGKGRVRCEIEEGEWERRAVTLCLIFEKAPMLGEHYSTCDLHSDISNEFGAGDAGTFTGEQIDWLIRALTVAREEADKRGLFTARTTPTTVEQVLAALG